MSSVVYQEVSNDFSNLKQTIDNRDIASVIYSPFTPTDSKVLPKRTGELYVQIQEGSSEHRARLWVGVAVTGGKFEWEEVGGAGALPDTVARTDKVNDFQPYEQKISGKQILSFVDGGDLTPEQSKAPADYDGQFYIAVKTLSDGKKDASVWIAHGNQWLPFSPGGGTVDTTDLAKLKEVNTFEEANTFKKSVTLEAGVNLVGDPSHTRMISGTRIKRDRSPIADSGWKAVVEGEKTIYINETTEPAEISIWTAVKLNSNPLSNAGEWVMTWSSKGSAGVLPDNVALVDKVNVFTPLQQMGDEVNQVFLTGARVGPINPKGVIVPLAFGEVYIRQITGTNNFEFYMAAEEADTDSWVRIYDNGMWEGFNQRIGVLEDEDTAVNERITMLDADLDRFGITLGQLDADMTTVEGDVAITKDNIATLDGRVNIAERQIRELDGRVTAVETHVPKINDHADRIVALESSNSFIGLPDTPSEITADKVLIVNSTGDAIVESSFTATSVGSAITRADTALGIANQTNANFDSFKNSDFNPLKITVTNLGTSVTRIDTKMGQLETQGNTSANKISAIEGDIGETTSPSETSIKGRLNSAEGRLTTLENEPDPSVSFVQLTDTPSTLTANKVLVINGSGNAVTQSSFSTSDISTAMTTATNAMNKANTLETSIGGDFTPNTVKGRIKELETKVDNLVVWTLYLQGDS